MFLEYPLSLIALAALPVVVVIYLLKNRSRKQVVSALFLWSSPNLSSSQGQRLQKTFSSWLLLLEAIILTLLVFAAADVHVRWRPQDAPTVLILDDSWSMKANQKSAIEKIHQWINERKIVFPVDLILVGKSAIRDGKPYESFTELESRLSQWETAGTQSPQCDDLTIKEALERFCPSGSQAHAVIVTDQNRQTLAQDGKVTVLSVGTPKDNLAFTSVVRHPSSVAGLDMVIVEVANLSAKKQDVVCKLKAEKNSDFPVSIPEGKTIEIKTSVASDQIATFELPDDALKIDNQAILPQLPRKTIRVCVNISNPVLLPAVKKAIELSQDGQRKIEFVTDNEDLFVTDRQLTEEENKENQAYKLIFTVPDEPLDKIEPTVYKGPYIANSSNELMVGTDFSGILWGVENKDRKLEPNESALLSVGDVPLIVESVSLSGDRTIRVALIPELSNLIQSPNFPIFIYNVVKQRALSMPGLTSSCVKAGEPFVINSVKSDSSTLEAITPHKKSESIKFRLGQAAFSPYDIGLYELAYDDQKIYAAVNAINRKESDLQTLESGQWGERYSTEQKEKEFYSLRIPLILLALALAAIHQILVVKEN